MPQFHVLQILDMKLLIIWENIYLQTKKCKEFNYESLLNH